jgi:hypothetical protein
MLRGGGGSGNDGNEEEKRAAPVVINLHRDIPMMMPSDLALASTSVVDHDAVMASLWGNVLSAISDDPSFIKTFPPHTSGGVP